MAGEYRGSFSTLRAGNTRIEVSAGMDVGESAASAFSLDVRARAAVSGQAVMKLILAVFGIAALFIIIWIILWTLAMRKKE